MDYTRSRTLPTTPSMTLHVRSWDGSSSNVRSSLGSVDVCIGYRVWFGVTHGVTSHPTVSESLKGRGDVGPPPSLFTSVVRLFQTPPEVPPPPRPRTGISYPPFGKTTEREEQPLPSLKVSSFSDSREGGQSPKYDPTPTDSTSKFIPETSFVRLTHFTPTTPRPGPDPRRLSRGPGLFRSGTQSSPEGEPTLTTNSRRRVEVSFECTRKDS